MARQATFPLYDRILGGTLTALIRDNRKAGLTPAEIRDVLRDDHDVTVSVETVRRWVRELEAAA